MTGRGRQGRTGAHGAGAGEPGVPRRPGDAGPTPQARVRTATYRGIHWRKDPDGTLGWYNEDAGGWYHWRPGGDNPPLPPRWEADAARIPVPPRVRHASWRSPYRLVPIVLVAAAVGLGVAQAARSTDDAAATARRDAHALLGRCLEAKSSGSASSARRSATYDSSPVSCTSGSARVKVVAVRDATAGAASCPDGTTALQLSYAGARTPDIECVRPLRPAPAGLAS